MTVAAHPAKIYFKATSGTPTGSDEVDGINDFSAQSSKTMLDTTDFKDTSGVKTKMAGLEDGSFSISGDYESGDTVQVLLRSTFDAGATAYLTIEFDPTASAGSRGYKYPVILESYDARGSADGKAEFSCSMSINGAKTAI